MPSHCTHPVHIDKLCKTSHTYGQFGFLTHSVLTMDETSSELGNREDVMIDFYSSNKKSPSAFQQRYSEIRITLLTILFITGIVIGVILKTLLIYAAWKQRNSRVPALTWFIISLMGAGMLHLLVVLPFEMTEVLHPNWKFGEVFCKAYEYQKFVDLYSIAYHLVFICLYLLMEVCQARVIRLLDRRSIMGLTLLTGWLLVFLANIPHASGHGTGSYPNSDKVFCYSKGFHRTNTMKEWVIANFIFLYLLPVLLMTCSCVFLWIRLLSDSYNWRNPLDRSTWKKDYAFTVTATTVLFWLLWGIPRVQSLLATVGAMTLYPGTIQRDVGNILLHAVLPAALPVVFLLGIGDFRHSVSDLFGCYRQGSHATSDTVQSEYSGVDNPDDSVKL